MSAVIEPADAAHAAPAAAHGHDAHAEHKVRNITFVKVAVFLAIITALETSTYWWPDDMHTVGMVVLFVSMIIKFFVILLGGSCTSSGTAGCSACSSTSGCSSRSWCTWWRCSPSSSSPEPGPGDVRRRVLPGPVAFAPNPEVYLLVAFLIGAYVYLVRVLQPSAVAAGAAPVSRRQWGVRRGESAVLFFAGTWPLHQVGEDYLYFMHMVQHLLLSMVLPPLIWMATPAWLLRVLIGQAPVAGGALHVQARRRRRRVQRDGRPSGHPRGGERLHHQRGVALRPAPAGGAELGGAVVPGDRAAAGDAARLRRQDGVPFLSSVISTVPAMWMAMADGVVYDHYGDQPVRVWGMSAMEDQQIAGIIMKTGGGLYLWAVILTMFVRRFSREQKAGGAAPAATAAPSASPARAG